MKNEQAALLSVSSLSKSFWNDGLQIRVLSGVHFDVRSGEVVALIGPSGIGKSTLLNLIGTLDKPDDGQILYNGQNPLTLSDPELARFRNSHIGFVFQFHHLLPEFTALENVMLPVLVYEFDRSKAAKQASEILNRVGLGNRLRHRPAQLSGGERQRVAIARALVNNPLIVLADEPTGNLDTKNSDLLIELILELNQQYQRTFVIATHNPHIAARAHRVLTIADGTVTDQIP